MGGVRALGMVDIEYGSSELGRPVCMFGIFRMAGELKRFSSIHQRLQNCSLVKCICFFKFVNY